MDNSNNNNRFISPNRFGGLFYKDINEDNERVTNNTDSTKTLLNDQMNKKEFGRKYNNNDNTGRPGVVINVLSLEQILMVKHWVTLK